MTRRRSATGTLRLHRRVGSGGGFGGRRSGPTTPLLRWNLEDPVHFPTDTVSKPETKPTNDAVTAFAGDPPRGLSARKLAAAVWLLRPPELVAGGVGGERCTQSFPRHIHVQLLKSNTDNSHHSSKNDTSSPISVLDPKNVDFHKINSAERATKWDPESLNSSTDEAYKLVTQLNLTENSKEKITISSLQLELDQARSKISKLETEKQNAKKKLDQFLNKISEDKIAWRKREHEKVRAIIEGMKEEIEREKKTRRRLEIINSKLINDLKETKLSTKQVLQDFEKERKSRELIEEVCDELAKEVEDDKVEIEILKNENLKIREEIDEERKMLQMAEVWREERVQMKLIDAKITLETKFKELTKLQEEIERFLIEKQSSERGDLEVINEAGYLLKVVNSVSNQVKQIDGFNYEPPRESEDIVSIFEELREIEPCCKNSKNSPVNSVNLHESEIQAVSPETDIFLEKPTKLYENGSLMNTNDESESEGVSSWETISRDEGLASSNSIVESEPSVNNNNNNFKNNDDDNNNNNNICEEIDVLVSGEMNQIPRKKESAISRLLFKSSRTKNSENNCKKDSGEIVNGRISNARTSIGTCSPELGFHEIGLSPNPSLGGHWSSPDSINFHYSKGFRGCIECPRGIQQKQSLKAKLLEARMESQKLQLKHVLKQKI